MGESDSKVNSWIKAELSMLVRKEAESQLLRMTVVVRPSLGYSIS